LDRAAPGAAGHPVHPARAPRTPRPLRRARRPPEPGRQPLPRRGAQPMIDLEITEGVAFTTLNAPATRNALNNELAAHFVARSRWSGGAQLRSLRRRVHQ